MTFYGNTIHDRCLRRPFYEAGKFAELLRRRRRAQGLVPVQAGLQRADDLQRLRLDQVGRRAFLPDPIRPSLPGLLGAGFLGRRRILPGSVGAARPARRLAAVGGGGWRRASVLGAGVAAANQAQAESQRRTGRETPE